MRKRFTYRRSVGLTPSVAQRVEAISVAEGRSFEHVLRLLIVEALRSRESKPALPVIPPDGLSSH